jgi:hypothetical protein
VTGSTTPAVSCHAIAPITLAKIARVLLVMGSIYYNSTVTLAAADSPDSSGGLHIPATSNAEYPWLGVTALPSSFSNNQGHVYISGPLGSVYGSPDIRVYNGILQSRGWV